MSEIKDIYDVNCNWGRGFTCDTAGPPNSAAGNPGSLPLQITLDNRSRKLSGNLSDFARR